MSDAQSINLYFSTKKNSVKAMFLVKIDLVLSEDFQAIFEKKWGWSILSSTLKPASIPEKSGVKVNFESSKSYSECSNLN